MELVDGEDLAQRLARGPIAVADALSIARQLADAIAAAHERAIIHRDLKPSNIRITADRTVKVLDFGIAKALQSDSGAPDSAPTVTGLSTALGGIIGTAAYMSPEQARGGSVDARGDVWAYGCVLYEMLTGRLAFSGATASDTIARILEREPDWEALPASTPPSLRRLLSRCLDKDPKRRLHAIADAQFDLDEALIASTLSSEARDPRTHRRIGRGGILLAAAVSTLVAVGLWKFLPRAGAMLPPAREMVLTSYPGIEARPTISPDGRQVAFSWDGDAQDNEDIYVVIVGSDSPHRVTTNPARDVSPAWKPGESEIAFARMEGDRALIYVVSPLGHSERKLAEFSAVPVRTGPRDMNDPLLSWSPDGRWLAVSHKAAGSEQGIFLLAHDGSARQLLVSRRSNEDYVPAAFSPHGTMLAYVDSGQVQVVEIDATNSPVVITKPARPLTRYLGSINGLTWTADGKDLIFGRSLYAAPPPSRLWRVPASGDREAEPLESGVASSPAMSWSTHRLAFSRRNLNVDMMKLREGGEVDTVAASTFNEFDASFSSDGTKVAFASDRTGEGTEIWVANADGTGRRPVTNGNRTPEGSPRWSPDGGRLAYDGLGDDGQRHVYVIDQAGGPSRELPSKPGFFDQVPSWSRDGKWIYFGSNRSSTEQVWRVPADGGGAQQVTTGGGGAPFESWDGQTLYYSRPIPGGRTLFEMPVIGGAERQLGVSVWFWNYLPGERGLYYASLPIGSKPPYTYEVRLLDSAGRTRVLHRVRLAGMSPGLSIQPDGKTVLVSGAATIGQDLFRIENFR
jgi:Tol biopolymer transport system component